MTTNSHWFHHEPDADSKPKVIRLSDRRKKPKWSPAEIKLYCRLYLEDAETRRG